MKTILLLALICLIPQAYSQEETPTDTEEKTDPAQAIKNNFALGPYDREGNFNPSANQPDEKYEKQAMEETPELMQEPEEDN